MNKTPVIPAYNLTLYDVETRFNLEFLQEDSFFLTWLDDIPELTPEEKRRLDRVKQQYLYLAKREMLEEVVKIVVVSPLLDLAGFFNSPFSIAAEREVQIDDEVNGDSIRGKIDFLVFQGEFWIAVIETKRTKADVMVALPQTLVYMVASPNLEKPVFGLMINGREAVFIKLSRENKAEYSLSKSFSISNPGNEFYDVLRGLKKIGQSLI
ncbi:type I restriction enzyme R domain protein [Lyngbya aestuarii BL J]|uniref:Type I restriction enzyme R domain protein n=1 Tax=Lyngbya aestuarii BL J TaxID=1348334 RepID=U7Q9X0_9CYAN|nr:type I restriction endonuclease [Lyngbya aestuarii]ERT04624.1 type I restriction enzyme R domain protein [Lyngbya aestuarii BL J]